MDLEQLESLRARSAAWRLLRVDHAPLILSFLGTFFIAENRGATASGELVRALEDALYAHNAADPEHPQYPLAASDYLEKWSADKNGWLRRFYPLNATSDEPYYDATPALEKAYSWVSSLKERPFVATESRLQTVVELLRQMVRGADADPQARIAELRQRREAIDREIDQIEKDPQAGLLDPTGLRDRYQQFASTTRELLADFREVEANFRALDRSAREQIATWERGKGELLADLVSTRTSIDSTDQGRSFQAFYDILLSESRQDELSELLEKVAEMKEIQADRSLRTVHHDWFDAAERTQHTVRQISEQLRRFLDDQVWLENRRVLELIKGIESHAVSVRTTAPEKVTEMGLTVDVPGIGIAMPLERPLYRVQPDSEVDSLVAPAEADDVDTSALAAQTFVNQAKLAARLRAVIPNQSAALLDDIVEMYPVEQGAAEILGYLSLHDDDLEVHTEHDAQTTILYDEAGTPRRAQLPRISVRRR